MSRAGYPYDNAPMERYFNTLKNEYINLYEFKTDEDLYKAVDDFSYVEYNHVRPQVITNMLLHTKQGWLHDNFFSHKCYKKA